MQRLSEEIKKKPHNLAMECLQKLNLSSSNIEVLKIKIRLGQFQASSINGGNRKHLIMIKVFTKSF